MATSSARHDATEMPKPNRPDLVRSKGSVVNPTAVPEELPEPITNLVRILETAYHGTVSGSTVEAIVRSCYAPFTDATITNYLPNIVEHASRDRLRQLTAS